jgi:hypothetical protein
VPARAAVVVVADARGSGVNRLKYGSNGSNELNG